MSTNASGRHNKLRLYVHLIWSTWDRVPLINEELERHLYRALGREAEAQNCQVIAIGGVEDHVHLLLSFPASLCIADLVKRIKGVSSRSANTFLSEQGQTVLFKWQASYAALTVSRWDVKQINHYIAHQKEHHAQGTTKPQLEDFYKPKSAEN